MTEFILLTLDAEAIRPWTAAQQKAGIAAMAAFKVPLEAAGRLKDSGGLGPDLKGEGARVRVENGRTSIEAAPFDDVRNTVGGYLIVECASLEEAIALARQ